MSDPRDPREQRRAAACERAALRWLQGLRDVEHLLGELVVDDPAPAPAPRRPTRPTPPPIPREIAEGVLRAAQDARRPLRRLAQLRAIDGVDERVVALLLRTGCHQLDREPTEPDDPGQPDQPEQPHTDRPPNVVGVLLPVRIETRFGPGDHLRVRIVPDEPWFTRHDEHPTDAELEALELYATTVAADADQSEAAWRRFVGQVGGARAAWLQRTYADRLDDAGRIPDGQRPETADDAPHWPRIAGFPDQLEIWLARGGGAPARVATLDVVHERLLADLPLPEEELDTDADPFAAAPARWWSSFAEAEAVGLATTLTLDGSPDDIDVLYVVGVGGAAPAELFGAHRDAGLLGTIEPGTPTATVDGVPAADTTPSPDTWARIAAGGTPGAAQRALSRALTGAEDTLGLLPHTARTHDGHTPDERDPATGDDQDGDDAPGSGLPIPRDARAVVTALWPALWGYALRDVFGLGTAIEEVATWASESLAPEGPYPTLRIGTQPYGVLPVTSTSRWRPSKYDPGFEAAASPAATQVRDRLAAAAKAHGTAAGADAQQLHDLLSATPTSTGYQHRHELPSELWFLLQLLSGVPFDWLQFQRTVEEQQRFLDDLGLSPARRYLSHLPAETLRLPLVLPEGLAADRFDEALRYLADLAWLGGRGALGRGETDEAFTSRFGTPPDSLLLRLVIRSLQLALADIGWAQAGEERRLDPVAAPLDAPDTIVVTNRVAPGMFDEDEPTVQALRRVMDAVVTLGRMDLIALERRFRATLDCASHRIDPWVTGLALRRLEELLDAVVARGEDPPMRLGAYGWVDRPRPGSSGPTDGGLLHAPSEAQATTAAILRDRAVADPEPERWQLTVDSASARLAEQLGAAVRDGLHLSEAVGAEVERIVEDRGTIDALRAAFPVHPDHGGRRVCDGLAVLAAPAADLPVEPGTVADGFDALRAALDTYADLLVAQAVYDVVDGRAETAGAAMDAAAGRARPPDLDVLHTDREGMVLASRCVLALEDVAGPQPGPEQPLAMLSPGTVAEPALAALLEDHLGGAQTWSWKVAPGDNGAAGTEPASTSVSLEAVGLTPLDAVALSLADLEGLLARRVGGELADATHPGRDRYTRAVALVDGLAHAPATARDLTPDDGDGGVPTGDVAQELRDRLTQVRAVGLALVEAMDTADTEEAHDAVLTAASRWGIVPDLRAEDGSSAARVQAARDRLQRRLDAAPRMPAPGEELDEDLDAQTLDPRALAEAIVALASGTGHLTVWSRLPGAALPATLFPDTGELGNDWLPTIAEVREPVARLDAALLGEELHDAAPLRAWSNRPDDPWQTTVIAAQREAARTGEDPQLTAEDRRLLVGFAPPDLDLHAPADEALFAVGLVDRWSETVPEDHHATAAAFGFDAPAARAPQAILLAVPALLGAELDTDGCVSMLDETRALLRARMAPPGADPDLAPLLPSVLLPASGPSAVHLEPSVGDDQ